MHSTSFRAAWIAAAILTVPLLSTAASAAVVFSNGFESPVINGNGNTGNGYDNYGTGASIGPWTVVGPPGAGDAVSVAPTTFTQNGFSFVSHSGNQWADLAGQQSNTLEGVQTTISGLLGQAYTVSFWVGNIVDPSLLFGTSTTVNLFVNDVPVFTAINTDGVNQTSQVWRQFFYSSVGTSNSTTFKFLNGDPPTDFSTGFDDVLITTNTEAVPEPTTWTVLLLGLAGVGFIARRRKSQRAIA